MSEYRTDLEILSYVDSAENGVADVISLTFFICDDADRRISSLRDRQLIEPANATFCEAIEFGVPMELSVTTYRLTPNGKERLLEEQRVQHKVSQDVADYQSEQKRMSVERSADIRREYILFFAGLVLGWLLGQISVNDVFNWMKSLFH